MAKTDVAEVLGKPISQDMLNRDIARLAYVAKDGTPRVVSIGFTLNGSEVVMSSATNAPKLVSLRGTRQWPSPSAPRCTHRRSC